MKVRSYSETQASKVLEACARAAHEARVAVDEAVYGGEPLAWTALPIEMKDLARRNAALALDLLAKLDGDGDEGAQVDVAIATFAVRISQSRVRANLFLSVVAAVKTTLDKDML